VLDHTMYPALLQSFPAEVRVSAETKSSVQCGNDERLVELRILMSH